MQNFLTNSWARWLLVLMATAGLAGCPPYQRQPALVGSGMEMFAPVTMRVHPLSRVVSDGKTTRLQARIELTDQMGDVGKAVGTGELELFEYQRMLPGHRGHLMGQWPMDIGTPYANRTHWDGITRTYLFDIALPDATAISAKGKYVLAGTFILSNGMKFKDEAVVGGK